jgi:4-amino-4-deoxy-L-arabinose transferase-like glycosyltransferase
MTPRDSTGSPAGRLALLILLVTLWRLALAWLLPVTQDEAYYFDWTRSLAWGYFDHPPGVALLGLGTLLAPSSALAGRVGTLIAATLTLVVLVSFYRRCGLGNGTLLLALVLAAATIPGIGGGVIATPDTALALCWVLALHEALAALEGDRRRWLGAGLAVGLGLLAKYPMVLIGPVFLWALVRTDPRALRTPWPYLGGLVALLVFTPHILWNAQNDWVTVRFQLGHGFASETGPLLAHGLPEVVQTTPAMADDGPRTAGERILGVLGYLGTQAALWGLLLIPVVAALVHRRPSPAGEIAPGPALNPGALPLLWAGTVFPLLFFAWIASLARPEANWPAMYLVSAAPLATRVLGRVAAWVWVAAAGNALLVTLYVLHAATAALPLGDRADRVLRETHGYRELAGRAAALDGLVFADGYQTAAMLRFYQPGLAVTQWPGVTRPSEYLRGVIAPPAGLDQVRRAGGFWLVGRRTDPPQIPGFAAQTPQVLIDCKGVGLVQVAPGSPEEAQPPCPRPLHRWQLVRYVATGEPQQDDAPKGPTAAAAARPGRTGAGLATHRR